MAITQQAISNFASASATSVTTSSWTPASNTLLVAVAGLGNGNGTAATTGAMTDSLGGTWTLLKSETTGNGAVADIFCRDIATGSSMTCTYTRGGTTSTSTDVALVVVSYSGAAVTASQTGATVAASLTNLWATSITTTTTGSLVVGSVDTGSTTPASLTPNANTTSFGSFLTGAAGDAVGLFRTTSLTGTPGSITVGYSNTDAGTMKIALVEILPAATASNPPFHPVVVRQATVRASVY